MRVSLVVLGCIGFVLAASTVEAAGGKTYRVGAASVSITPKVAPDAPPVWLAGYGMGRRAQKIHDDIYARAMVIHDGKFGLAVVACDLVGLFYDQVEMIRAEVDKLGLTPKIDYVLVSSTHTHAGPDTVGMWGPIGRTGLIPGHMQKVRSACVEAIRKAHAKSKRATLWIAQTDANGPAKLIGDSRKPIAIDSTMTVIQARTRSGKAVVTFVNVPCHPEVLGSKNPQLSSDFPSTMRTYLEDRFGGMAIYNSGTVGGLLAPRVPGVDPFSKAPMPGAEIDRMMAFGRIMGRIAELAAEKAKPLTGSISVKSQNVLLPVWNRVYKVGMGVGLFNRQVFDAEGNPVAMPDRTDTQRAKKIAAVKDPHLKSEVALVQIGPLQIAAIPGEIYPEITLGAYQRPQEKNADFPGAPLEPTIFPLMTAKYKMVIGLANDEVGYIIPKSQWDWFGPYAYGRKDRQYGEFNSCSPEVAPILMAAWAKLIKEK